MNAITIHAEAIRNKDSWDTNQPPKKAKAAIPLAICNVSIALRIFPKEDLVSWIFFKEWFEE